MSRDEVTTRRWVGCVQQWVSSWSCPTDGKHEGTENATHFTATHTSDNPHRPHPRQTDHQRPRLVGLSQSFSAVICSSRESSSDNLDSKQNWIWGAGVTEVALWALGQCPTWSNPDATSVGAPKANASFGPASSFASYYVYSRYRHQLICLFL